MLIAAATPISFIEAMSNAVNVDNAVFIFLKDNKKEKETHRFRQTLRVGVRKVKTKKKNLKLSLFMLYSRVNIQAETRNHLSQSQRTLKKSALVKKEERKQDSLLLPFKRAKRQSFLVL